VEESLRRQYLEAMGIENWVVRDPVPAAVTKIVETAASSEPSVAQELPSSQVVVAAEQSDQGLTPDLDARNDVAVLDWEALKSRVVGCQACSLHQTRTQTVFGVGNQSADLMIIGEAPGADEDRQGEPFVGRAGLLLNAMLKRQP